VLDPGAVFGAKESKTTLQAGSESEGDYEWEHYWQT
jgi:hypothetical protein